MKRQTSLWGSISVLIGVIVGIVALVRGPAFYPMILLAFAVWGVWAVLTLGLPRWRTGYVRRQMANETQSVRSELDAANVPVDVAQTLLRHVNYRISAYLKSSHPNARWEWVTRNPALLAVQGGIGRIRLYGVDDYDYADVELDQQGSLSCSLVRLMAEQMPDGEPPASPGMPLDPRIWYDQQGRETLEMLIADLNSRGYKHLALKEDGSICTSLDGANEETIQSTFSNFPAKVYWPQLAKVLEQEGLATTVEANCVSVAW